MNATQVDVINMRLNFMGMVLAVLARSLPPRESAHATQEIGERIIEQLGRNPVSESAEEAVTADLAPKIAARWAACTLRSSRHAQGQRIGGSASISLATEGGSKVHACHAACRLSHRMK